MRHSTTAEDMEGFLIESGAEEARCFPGGLVCFPRISRISGRIGSTAGRTSRDSRSSAPPPRPTCFEGEHQLESAWQHRTVQGDLASSLLRRFAEDAARTDLVIWDLIDERMGVQPLGDGCYGTITPDSLRSGILEAFAEVGDPVSFGAPEHLETWADALVRFVTLLDALGLRSPDLRPPPPVGLSRRRRRASRAGGWS